MKTMRLKQKNITLCKGLYLNVRRRLAISSI
nr:MAG TPA_asm: hypothetical protein [Caudoviricetes sp.]